MAAKGWQWKSGRTSAPKAQEHRPELKLRAVPLTHEPANENARASAPKAPGRSRKSARGDGGAKVKGHEPHPEKATDSAKAPRRSRKRTPEAGTENAKSPGKPAKHKPGEDGESEKKKGKDGRKRGQKRKGKDKDKPFKPSVTFGDITAAVAGAAERAAQFASTKVQEGAAFATGE